MDRNNNFQHRYGKFNPHDYISYMIFAGFYTIIILVCILLVGINFKSVLMFLSLIYVWGLIIFPYMERFSLQKNSITAIKFRKKEKFDLPQEITIILSYTARPRYFIWGKLLKNKVSVSIICHDTLAKTLEILHPQYMECYTNESVEDLFGYRYIYDFVCNQNSLSQLLLLDPSLIIFPESLKEFLVSSEVLKLPTERIYIDKGY